MKLKKVTFSDPVERITIDLRQSTHDLIVKYQAYYKKTYGDEINRTQLIEEILRGFMVEDKAFQAAQPTK